MNHSQESRKMQTILLVEDESLVSDLIMRILKQSGYTVLTAANGKEALEIYGQMRADISLIILDLMLPVMGGKQCLDEIRKIDPNLKILVTSGYPINKSMKKAIISSATYFIAKPYNIKQILDTVQDILNSD